MEYFEKGHYMVELFENNLVCNISTGIGRITCDTVLANDPLQKTKKCINLLLEEIKNSIISIKPRLHRYRRHT